MKLIIKVSRNDAMIDEVFNELETEGVFGKMQLRVFKMVYKSKVKGMYRMIKIRLSSYKSKEGDDWFPFMDGICYSNNYINTYYMVSFKIWPCY